MSNLLSRPIGDKANSRPVLSTQKHLTKAASDHKKELKLARALIRERKKQREKERKRLGGNGGDKETDIEKERERDLRKIGTRGS